MTLLLKTDFSDAQVAHTDDPQWDKLVLPSGEIPIMYEAGTIKDRNALVLADPTDNSNKALSFEIHNATIPGDREGYYKGRVQLNCAMPDAESVTMRTRLLLDLEAYRSYPKANGWFTLIELWAGAANSKYPFRISVNVVKDTGSSVFFSVTGSLRNTLGKWFTMWTRINRVDRPTLCSWFDLELSCRRGNYRTGYVLMSMNDKELFDITNWTYSRFAPTPVQFTMLQPCKLYTSGAVIDHMREAGQPAHILWNSLEIST